MTVPGTNRVRHVDDRRGLTLDRTLDAIVFDWHATAVRDRHGDARSLRRRLQARPARSGSGETAFPATTRRSRIWHVTGGVGESDAPSLILVGCAGTATLATSDWSRFTVEALAVAAAVRRRRSSLTLPGSRAGFVVMRP